jgi:HAD superfamily hydrolase (TIGR01450 family)
MTTPAAGRAPLSGSGAWVVDLDGVVWLAGEPIPGSAHAVAELRRVGIRVLFASNNSAPTLSELLARLERAGIDADPGDIVTSAQAAAAMLDPGTTAFPCAEAGVAEALVERGVAVVGSGPADAVVVGWTRRFDFTLLDTTATLVRQGARFIGTNEDATYPTPEGLLPGAGAILAAVATAAQATPEVAGKPHPAMVELIRRRTAGIAMAVGDRPSTDGELARALGVPFGLVRSGVTRGGREPVTVEAQEDAADLLALVTRHLGP